MMTPQKYGFIIEDKITEFLKNTRHHIYTEKEIRQNYSYITAIDQMIILDDVCICFQDKWVSRPISNSMFGHFTKSCEYIKNSLNRPVIGIYLSNQPFSKEAANMLLLENNNNNNIIYYCLYDIQLNTLLNKLHNILHDNNIYIYDDDNEIVMATL